MIIGDKNVVNQKSSIPHLDTVGSISIANKFTKRHIGGIKVGGNLTRKIIKGKRINIVTWADIDKRTYMCWGDYWVKDRLYNAFVELGCDMVDDISSADVNIYLFGSPFTPRTPSLFNPSSYNILWLYSHPDKVTANEMSNYDEIFVLSNKFIKELEDIYVGKLHKEPLYGCTDFVTNIDISYGILDSIVLVANARGAYPGYGRDSVKYLSEMNKIPFDVKIWGHKWDNFEKYDKYPKKWFVEKYYAYGNLPKLYRSANAVIIDGHEDMWSWGFVPMKLYDVFASGGLPIIKKNCGIEEIFGDYVLQYENSKQLFEVLEYVKNNRNDVLGIIEKGREISLRHTYSLVAKRFLNSINNITKNRKIVYNDRSDGSIENDKHIMNLTGSEETVVIRKERNNRKGIIRI